MTGIIGSEAWQLSRDADFDPKAHLRRYLCYALRFDDGIRQVVVKRGAGDFEISGRIISRAEVVLAWQMLPPRLGWAIWDRIVCKRSVWELALAMGVTPRMVQYRVDKGLRLMLRQVYDPMQVAE